MTEKQLKLEIQLVEIQLIDIEEEIESMVDVQELSLHDKVGYVSTLKAHHLLLKSKQRHLDMCNSYDEDQLQDRVSEYIQRREESIVFMQKEREFQKEREKRAYHD